MRLVVRRPLEFALEWELTALHGDRRRIDAFYLPNVADGDGQEMVRKMFFVCGACYWRN